MSESTETIPDRPYVLVVEDSPTTRVVIERHLKQYFDLITAADGQEAWDLLQKDDKVELVITDINMPRMTGIELLQNIRSSGQAHINQLPVFIMTSADDDEADKHQALDLGANDFITKPINPIVLRARVNVHHRLAKATQHLQHDPATRTNANSASTLKLINGEQFNKSAEHEFEVAKNENAALSLLYFEIDQFGELSQKYSSNVCEDITGQVSAELARLLRGIDTGTYMGNGRYEILLPGTRRLGAAVVAERMRAAIERLDISAGDGVQLSITASVAMASVPAEKVDNIDMLKSICEDRLKIAHDLGNNRICVNNEGHTSFSRS